MPDGSHAPAPTVQPTGAPAVHRVIARLNIGGPAMHVVHLDRGLRMRGIPTRLITGEISPDEGDMAYYARDRGVEITSVPGLGRAVSALGDLRALWALYRLFRRERPGIVHTHTAKAGTIGRLAAILARVPVRIHTFHGHVLGGGYFPPRVTRIFLAIERTLARLTQRIVVLSPGQRDELSRGLGIAPPDRFAVIPLGLELDRFVPDRSGGLRQKLRETLGAAPDTPLIGIVGRLVPVKNHVLLLRALPLVPRTGSGPAPRLVVIGNGELEELLKKEARDLGIADRVHWLGWRQDLPDLYPGMDAMALVSLDEGTPVAVLEALAAEVPVVARTVGGVAEILEHGRWGRLVPGQTPADVAAALTEVLADPPTPELRSAIRDEVVSRYGVDRLVDDIEALYRREWTIATGMEWSNGVEADPRQGSANAAGAGSPP